MKRFFFSLIALAAVVTACTESGLIDTPAFYGNEIIFAPYVGKTPVTKAVSVDKEYLQGAVADGGGVQVYAFLRDKDVTDPTQINVTTPYLIAPLTYSDNAWGYGELAYWPEGKELAFAAYSMNATDCMSNHSETAPTQFDFTVNDVMSEQVDLLAIPFKTDVTGNENGDTHVELRFYHLLSRVGFSVQPSEANDDVAITIKSLKLCGSFPKSGHVDLTKNPAEITPYKGETDSYASEYSLLAEGETFTIESTACVEVDAQQNSKIVSKPIYPNSVSTSDAENRFMMIMPGSVESASIEVVYQLSGDEERTARVALNTWNFVPGYAYEFILKISTAAIQFEALFGAWGSPAETDKDLVPVV